MKVNTATVTRGVAIAALMALGFICNTRPGLAQAGATVPWFTYTSGTITCRGSQVMQTPIRISYLCFNNYGASAGSYTADAINGGSGTNVFSIGLTDTTAVAVNGPASSVNCLVGMNATAQPVTMGSLGIIQPKSAAYACAGINGGQVSWP